MNAIHGTCIEAGDDDEGQPRLVIHTTREELEKFKGALVYNQVTVTLTEKEGE